MPPNARIIPRVWQAWMQPAAIGKTCAARYIGFGIYQQTWQAARRELVKAGYAGQTAANNDS